jgi:hypothetical protein
MADYTLRIKSVNYVFQPNDTVFSVNAYLTDTRNNPFLDSDGAIRYITFTFYGSSFPTDTSQRLNFMQGICMEQLRKVFAQKMLVSILAGNSLIEDIETTQLIAGMSVSGSDSENISQFAPNTTISAVRPTSVVISAQNIAAENIDVNVEFGVESWNLVWTELETKFLNVINVDELLL